MVSVNILILIFFSLQNARNGDRYSSQHSMTSIGSFGSFCQTNNQKHKDSRAREAAENQLHEKFSIKTRAAMCKDFPDVAVYKYFILFLIESVILVQWFLTKSSDHLKINLRRHEMVEWRRRYKSVFIFLDYSCLLFQEI